MKKVAVKNPWSFAAPEYDQRSSVFVNAGSHYGCGKPQPVGSTEHKKAGPIHFGRHLPDDKLVQE